MQSVTSDAYHQSVTSDAYHQSVTSDAYHQSVTGDAYIISQSLVMHISSLSTTDGLVGEHVLCILYSYNQYVNYFAIN